MYVKLLAFKRESAHFNRREGKQVVDQVLQVVRRRRRVPQRHLQVGSGRPLEGELEGAEKPVERRAELVTDRAEEPPFVLGRNPRADGQELLLLQLSLRSHVHADEDDATVGEGRGANL